MIARVYNRKMPAPLPAHRMITQRAAALPGYVDLRKWGGPLKDQGSEGSCTGHAGTSSGEWICRKYFGKQPVFSPQYTYAKELIAQGSFPQDVGSDGVTLCNTTITSGLCELSVYPYVAGRILQPTPEQDENAGDYRMGAYHGLVGSGVALSVIGDPTPWPVLIGFTVFSSFESDQVAETGIYNPDRTKESVLGGHEVVMLGYDVGPAPSIRPAGCPPAALIQNSWSASWGIGGFFWMALPVLDDPQTDLKIVHTGRPWGAK
jgi:Papain family cysteine protease